LAVPPQTVIDILNTGSPVPEKLLFLPFHLIKGSEQRSTPSRCWRQHLGRRGLLSLWSWSLMFLFIYGLSFHLMVEWLAPLIAF
jgi:hypothetical protein